MLLTFREYCPFPTGGGGGWEEGVGRRSNDDYESSRPSRRNTISRAYAFRRRRAMPELIRRPAA